MKQRKIRGDYPQTLNRKMLENLKANEFFSTVCFSNMHTLKHFKRSHSLYTSSYTTYIIHTDTHTNTNTNIVKASLIYECCSEMGKNNNDYQSDENKNSQIQTNI